MNFVTDNFQVRQMQIATNQRLLSAHYLFFVSYRLLHGHVAVENHAVHIHVNQLLNELRHPADVRSLMETIRNGDELATAMLRDILEMDGARRARVLNQMRQCNPPDNQQH